MTLTHITLYVLLRLFCRQCPACYLLLLITYFFLHSVVNKIQSNLLPSVASSFSVSLKGTLANINVNGKEDRTRKEDDYCTRLDGLVCKDASPTNGHVVSKTLGRKFLVTLVFRLKTTWNPIGWRHELPYPSIRYLNVSRDWDHIANKDPWECQPDSLHARLSLVCVWVCVSVCVHTLGIGYARHYWIRQLS